jgi:hypothetical protein
MPSSSYIPVAQALQRHSGGWKQTPPAKREDSDLATIAPADADEDRDQAGARRSPKSQ